MTALPLCFSHDVALVVKNNDLVSVGQVIAKKILKNEFVVDLARDFSMSPEKIRKSLRKKPGDEVKKGEVLAIKKGFLGLSVEKILSRVEGKFLRFERESGKIVIGQDGEGVELDIVSPVEGRVVLCNNEKLVIESDKDSFKARKGFGGSVIAEVYILDGAFENKEKERDREISLYYALDSEAVNKIVVGKMFPRDLLIKSAGMGVAGIVGTEIRDEDIEYLAKRKMEVPLLEVDNEIIENLKKWKGKKFYMNSQEREVLFLHA